jgi:hypothetical protein
MEEVSQNSEENTTASSQSTDTSGRNTTTKNVSPVEGAQDTSGLFWAAARLEAACNKVNDERRTPVVRDGYMESPSGALLPVKRGDSEAERPTAAVKQETSPPRESGYDSPTLGYSYSYYEAPASVTTTADPAPRQQPLRAEKSVVESDDEAFEAKCFGSMFGFPDLDSPRPPRASQQFDFGKAVRGERSTRTEKKPENTGGQDDP